MTSRYAEVCRWSRHGPIALARARRQNPVIPHLVGARRWNQRHESFDQLASFHQDMRGAVAPAGFEADGESTIWAFFESIMGERRPSHVSNQPFQAPAISRGYIYSGVEAHAPVGGNAGRGLGVCVQLVGIDTITEASPAFAPPSSRTVDGRPKPGVDPIRSCAFDFA